MTKCLSQQSGSGHIIIDAIRHVFVLRDLWGLEPQIFDLLYLDKDKYLKNAVK